jgi:Heterokaryon incompatibility protein (HET)
MAMSNQHSIYTRPLDHTLREIRLLTIHVDKEPFVTCSIKTVSLLANPRFAALSYTWGNAEHKKQVLVNGQLVQVTVNLEEALRRLGASEL